MRRRHAERLQARDKPAQANPEPGASEGRGRARAGSTTRWYTVSLGWQKCFQEFPGSRVAGTLRFHRRGAQVRSLLRN